MMLCSSPTSQMRSEMQLCQDRTVSKRHNNLSHELFTITAGACDSMKFSFIITVNRRLIERLTVSVWACCFSIVDMRAVSIIHRAMHRRKSNHEWVSLRTLPSFTSLGAMKHIFRTYFILLEIFILK